MIRFYKNETEKKWKSNNNKITFTKSMYVCLHVILCRKCANNEGFVEHDVVIVFIWFPLQVLKSLTQR